MEERLGFSSVFDDRPDFLRDLLAFRPLSPEKLTERVSQIKEAMKNHQGEFFLAVKREWYFPGCTGFGDKPKEEDYIIEETIYMGTCTEPYLTTSGLSNLEIHTLAYVWPYPMGIYKEGGLLTKESYDLERPLSKKRRHRWEADYDPGLALQILVGDEEVSSWVFAHYKGRELLVYPKMAAMLGRPLPELPKQIKEFIQQRKQEIVENLLSLGEEDERLAAEIKRIYQLPEKGGILYMGGGLTLVEDADDAFIATWGQREKLEETRSRVKRILAEALELDMHKGKEILIREIRSGQTVEINMARLIQGFCEYYEVPIPHDQG